MNTAFKNVKVGQRGRIFVGRIFQIKMKAPLSSDFQVSLSRHRIVYLYTRVTNETAIQAADESSEVFSTHFLMKVVHVRSWSC